MQNQNLQQNWSWSQGNTPSFQGASSLFPTGFPAAGVDQSSLIASYQQMYGAAAAAVAAAATTSQTSTEYDATQWSATQMQQWQQWQQWQEKYQQWQAKYGKKYAETVAAMSQNPNFGLPPAMGVVKPGEVNPGYTSSNPPLPSNSQQPVPPPPPEEEKPPPPLPSAQVGKDKNDKKVSAPADGSKDNPEELSEAEKTFDVQFRQWEGQFNEWKKQNQDHPDKAQYREYEKKWEQWREQLLQRREQMRRKRLSKTAEPAKPENSPAIAEETKSKQPPETGTSQLNPEPDYSYTIQGIQPVPSSLMTFNTEGSNSSPFPNQENQTKNKKNQENVGNQNFMNQGRGMLNPDNFNQELNRPFGKFGNGGSGPGNWNKDSIDGGNRQGPFSKFQDNQNFNQQFFDNQNFDNMDRNFSQNQNLPNSRFRSQNFDSNNQRFGGMNRNQNRFSNDNFGDNRNDNSQKIGGGGNFDNDRNDNSQMFGKFDNDRNNSQRFGGGNFDNNSQRFGNFDIENSQRFGGDGNGGNLNNDNSQRFGGGNLNNDNSQRFGGGGTGNFDQNRNQGRFFDNDRENFNQNQFNFGGNNSNQRFNDGNFNNQRNFNSDGRPLLGASPSVLNTQKPKVPSLFDITFEKPPALQPRKWDDEEEEEDEDYYKDPFEEKPEEKWPGNSGNKWSDQKPWSQPWESERNADDGNRGPWEGKRGPFGNERTFGDEKQTGNQRSIYNERPKPWRKESVSKDQERAELSGYVGNLLAKLGSLNDVVPKINEPENPQKSAFPDESNLDKPNRNQSRKFNDDVNDQTSRDSFGPKDSGPNRQNNNSDRFGRKNFQDDSDLQDRFNDNEADDQFNRDRSSAQRDESPFGGQKDNSNDRFPNRKDDRFGRNERRFHVRDDREGRNRNGRGMRGPYDRFDDRRMRRDVDGPYDRYSRMRDSMPEPEWNPQVFDYSQGRSQGKSDPEKLFQFSKVVDYSHGGNVQTFDYGHGGAVTDKEVKSFDYGHGADAPAVIDYGHGGGKEAPAAPDWKKEKEKELEASNAIRSRSKSKSPGRRRSRSPRQRTRSKTPPNAKRGSHSPPFQCRRSRSRDRFGRPMLRRNRKENSPEEKQLPQPASNDTSKTSFDVTTVLVEDLICSPGRSIRPNKLVFIMRGLPGSGKTYVTKLIKDKEIEMGGDAPRILSLDDYFMTEVEREVTDEETGRKVKTKVLEYEYESGAEPHYKGSLLKAFKKTISDGFFSFIIVDSVNEKTKDYEEMWSFAKQKGFQVYVAEMDDDVAICTKRNIHKRTEAEISELSKSWDKTPNHYIRLDVRSLLQSDAITEVEMEVVSDTEIEKEKDDAEKKAEDETQEEEDEDYAGESAFVKSRWDNFENSEQKLDRLDGLKRRREGYHATMEDYLQLPDDFEQPYDGKSGKKRVRWADLEERRRQEKMRAIGFVVGQTDWSRMTDPTYGESALTRTKYI